MSRTPNPTPPATILHRCYHYDREAGFLNWKSRPVLCAADKRWNSNFAGKPAGTYSQGYVRVMLHGKLFLAHRLIFKMMTGEEPPPDLKHLNGNTCDNRWSNLSAINREIETHNALPPRLTHGDMREELQKLAENSIDACLTDPPFHLASMAARWQAGRLPAIQRQFAALSKGWSGTAWDDGDVSFDPATWREVHRVLKPGAHMLCFGDSKTSHNMTTAIEAAGFQIRDMLGWCFGSGFPAGSVDIGKAIDAEIGFGRSNSHGMRQANESRPDGPADRTITNHGDTNAYYDHRPASSTIRGTPSTVQGREWDGWGTKTKDAWVPIVVARKPLSEGSLARNVLKHGTGGLSIDACRLPIQPGERITGDYHYGDGKLRALGRWPANLLLDDPDILAGHSHLFWHPKIQRKQKVGNHPCQKPVDLLRYLLKLICAPGGIVIDPFAGSCSLGEAALLDGMHPVLIERELQYYQDGVTRLERVALPG